MTGAVAATHAPATVWEYAFGSEYWWIFLVKAVVILALLVTAAAYASLAERKVSARIQLRIGPNRVGPHGMLQPAADGLKFLFKENIAPAQRDKLLYLVAPSLVVGFAIFAFAVMPLGAPTTVNGYEFHWGVAHVNIGLLYILAITSLGVYSIFLGGWSANSKYSLLGGLRSSAQLISYEMAVAFALIGVVILAGSLDLEKIIEAQQHVWFIILQPVAFFLYYTGALAETNRAPFDLPEAESELVAGYHTEYSGMRFGMYFLGEYVNMVTVCSIATALFLGGWLPLLPWGFLGWDILGPAWFLGKVLILFLAMMWIRWTWPRLRYDKLMGLGWKVMLPLGLVNIVITGAVVALQA
jgi:NADH-quinone oxidoreductase subunit H